MTHCYDIVGFTFNADNYCLDCIDHVLIGRYPHVVSRDNPVNVLAAVARHLGINPHDEATYDSGDYPKVIFADQVLAGEVCGGCMDPLLQEDYE